MTLLNPCYKKENLKTPNRPRNNIMQTNDLEKKKKREWKQFVSPSWLSLAFMWVVFQSDKTKRIKNVLYDTNVCCELKTLSFHNLNLN